VADALFDTGQYTVEPEQALSPDRRRTHRQAQAVANGVHPLALALRDPTIQVHPDAPRDRTGEGPRCGSCWYRQRIYTNGNRRWPKCMVGVENDTDQTRGRLPRVTRGSGTDVRQHWPACLDYSPGDPRVSRDAARYVPEEAAQ
jgi:hypothetical protein